MEERCETVFPQLEECLVHLQVFTEILSPSGIASLGSQRELDNWPEALACYIPLRIFIDKKISFLNQLEILMPGLIDPQLTPLFGNLIPFAYDEQ
jgi:hypothetical protein